MTSAAQLRLHLLAFERNTFVRMSPDGQRIAFVRTTDAGQELWLRTMEGEERQLVAHHGQMLAGVRWSSDSATVMYRATPRGREAWALLGYAVDEGRRFEIAPLAAEFWLGATAPDTVAYSIRGELHRVRFGQQPEKISDGEGFHRWFVDGRLRPRGGTLFRKDGTLQMMLDGEAVMDMDAEGAVDFATQRFSADGRLLYVLSSHEAKTRRLIAVDSQTRQVTTLFEDPEVDIDSYPIAGDGVWFDPLTGEPDICAVMDQRLRYHALKPAVREAVNRLEGRDVAIVDRSADDGTWLIVYVRDDGPIVYHRYSPATGQSEELFVNRPELSGYTLARLEDFQYTAGDGWRIGGYAMRPAIGEPPYPTVVLVHGGPAGRDMFRFHADAQHLASLGYLSLHINYRGSKGFGIEFRRAGNGQWGARMQEDLYDAVAAGVERGLVDPARVAFLGTSYGGYASLLAACQRPDVARCAVAISAPCDLMSFVEKPPAYWQPLAILLARQVGRDGLPQRSPQHVLSARCRPLLLVHGVRDPRVPVEQMDRFADAASNLGVPVRYLRFDDEGHHVRANANRATLFAAIEDFLEGHLG